MLLNRNDILIIQKILIDMANSKKSCQEVAQYLYDFYTKKDILYQYQLIQGEMASAANGGLDT